MTGEERSREMVERRTRGYNRPQGVAPDGERAWKAGAEDLYFICIQAEAGSLTQATLEDGVRPSTKASWMKK
jgi:hypothetical protein